MAQANYLMLTALLVGTLINFTLSTCTFPSSLHGKWMSPDGAVSQFSSDSYSQGEDLKNAVYNYCEEQVDDDTYVVKTNWSTTTELEYEYYCLNLKKLSSTRYEARFLTNQMPGLFGDPPQYHIGTTYNKSELCVRNINEVPVDMIVVYWKKGENDYAVCPDELRNVWSYTATDNSVRTSCDNTSRLDVCSDKTQLHFDLSKCPSKIVSSTSGKMGCLAMWYNDQKNVQYLVLENKALSTGAACMVYSSGKASIRGGLCRNNQSPTNVGDPVNVKDNNYLLSLTKVTDSCPGDGSSSAVNLSSLSLLHYVSIVMTLLHSVMTK